MAARWERLQSLRPLERRVNASHMSLGFWAVIIRADCYAY